MECKFWFPAFNDRFTREIEINVKINVRYQPEGNSAIIMILLDQTTLVEREIPNWGTRAKIRIRPEKTKPVEYNIPTWETSTKIRVRPDKKHQLM